MITRNQLDEVVEKDLMNIRFFRFCHEENGFDLRMLTKEQEEEIRGDDYVWELLVRHADFGALDERYDSLPALIRDMNRRWMACIRQVTKNATGKRKGGIL